MINDQPPDCPACGSTDTTPHYDFVFIPAEVAILRAPLGTKPAEGGRYLPTPMRVCEDCGTDFPSLFTDVRLDEIVEAFCTLDER